MDTTDKIYIAGHNGLVGTAFTKKLREKGYTNLIFRHRSELDLRDQRQTESFFLNEKPDIVFLAAARVGGIQANDSYKAEFIYENIIIASNVIHAAYKAGVKKLLNLGSSCIYPKHAPQPLKEDYLLTGLLEPTNEPYAIAKIAAIKLCRYYNEQYGTNYISVMPTNMYGPYDNFNLKTSHVLPALLRKIQLAKLIAQGSFDMVRKDLAVFSKNDISDESTDLDDNALLELLGTYGIYKDKVLLWGSGKPYREFMYSEDLAEAGIFLMEKYDYGRIGEFVNIGTGVDMTIKETADIICGITGFAGQMDYDHSKPDGTPRKLLDVSRIHQLGWTPKYDLTKGLTRYYSWYLEQYST